MKKKKVQVQTDEVLFNSLAKRCFNKAKRCDSVTARGGLRELGRQYLEIAKKVAEVANAVNAVNAAERADRAAGGPGGGIRSVLPGSPDAAQLQI